MCYSFTVWIFYGASMLALIVLRYKEPKLPRPYKVNYKKIIIIIYPSLNPHLSVLL